MSESRSRHDRAMLDLAARVAWRGFGAVEPNPTVGCVIGREMDSGIEILGVGHHQRFGERHAEAEALRQCAERGIDPAGATAWVTLEPCNHHGKQPPCAAALARAGIARVVYASGDPNPLAEGGAAALRKAGIEVTQSHASPAAIAVSEPFQYRIKTGLPWVIAKWAQTIDGRIATASGDSKWISNEYSRRSVHRLRAKVDAVLTGIGTVLADDPLLTARGVPVRRVARRVVVDPHGKLPLDSQLVRSVTGGAPLTLAVAPTVLKSNASWYRTLLERGVDVVAFEPGADGRLNMADLLRWLVAERGCSTAMVESGPGLLGSLHRERLLNRLCVFVAPKLLADGGGMPPVQAEEAERVADAACYRLEHVKRIGDDVRLIYSATD
ncbi:MAG: bifunctional diaminohydroxyphosphoribosylaminopyrimidine deaminase/5-amino-6-(5-phosphoribosylamino)uracil reductase RibD [Phycisphaerales bacterium JB065]